MAVLQLQRALPCKSGTASSDTVAVVLVCMRVQHRVTLSKDPNLLSRNVWWSYGRNAAALHTVLQLLQVVTSSEPAAVVAVLAHV